MNILIIPVKKSKPGRSKYTRSFDEDKNYKNWFSPKNIKLEMSVDDIKSEIDELYGVGISPAML